MLRLLNIEQASRILMFWFKKIENPLSSETLTLILEDPELHHEYLLYQAHVLNAINAGEIPYIHKPRGKPEEDRFLDHIGIPEDDRQFLPKTGDYWVIIEDLVALGERPPNISSKVYAHSRDALARLIWALLKKEGYMDDTKSLNQELDDVLEHMEVEGYDCKIGQATLKGCIREILAAGEAISTKN